MKELKEAVKKSLIQQVELLNQTKVPAECNMICVKIHALAAVLAIPQDSQE